VEPLYFDNVQQDLQRDALLDDHFKLVCLQDGTRELYDLSTDAEEFRDIASNHPQRVQSMYNDVLRFREENAARKSRSTAAIDDNLDHLSEEQRRKAIEQLRSLGYIQ
jgi:hypothetical protein